jgi:hypothetical protein
MRTLTIQLHHDDPRKLHLWMLGRLCGEAEAKHRGANLQTNLVCADNDADLFIGSTSEAIARKVVAGLLANGWCCNWRQVNEFWSGSAEQ